MCNGGVPLLKAELMNDFFGFLKSSLFTAVKVHGDVPLQTRWVGAEGHHDEMQGRRPVHGVTVARYHHLVAANSHAGIANSK